MRCDSIAIMIALALRDCDCATRQDGLNSKEINKNEWAAEYAVKNGMRIRRGLEVRCLPAADDERCCGFGLGFGLGIRNWELGIGDLGWCWVGRRR